MKKSLLLGTILSLSCGMAYAAEPVVLPEFYSINISPDGKYIASETEYCSIYDVVNGVTLDYPSSAVGNGNAVAANGTAVGTCMEAGVIMKGGQEILPESLSGYTLSYLQAITPDATRVCGLVDNISNKDGYDGMMYEPFYAELSADGTLGEPQILPYPKKDFTGRLPQYCSAVWISDDGKTIVGQVIDYSGAFCYPIIYTQDSKGQWSYSLPSEALLNPDHIELPEDPGEFNVPQPQVVDYMTAEQAEAYNEAMEAYYASGYDYNLYPNAADYMTAEKAAEYNAASEAYNQAASEYNDKLWAYYEVFDEIMFSSVGFEQNSMTLSPNGKILASTGIKYEEQDGWPVEVAVNYQFDLEKDTYAPIETKYSEIRINQVFDNGTMIASTPMPSMWSGSNMPPMSYIRLAGESEFTPIEDYVATVNPEAATWMTDNLLHEIEVGYDEENDWAPIYEKVMFSGHVRTSRDLTVISGGVLAYYFHDEYLYMNYVMSGLTSGVESAVAQAVPVTVKSLGNGVLTINGEAASLTVTDLSGRTVYSTGEVSGKVSTGLHHGVYVVTTADADGQVKSVKVAL